MSLHGAGILRREEDSRAGQPSQDEDSAKAAQDAGAAALHAAIGIDRLFTAVRGRTHQRPFLESCTGYPGQLSPAARAAGLRSRAHHRGLIIWVSVKIK
jgi:hypothetical protein